MEEVQENVGQEINQATAATAKAGAAILKKGGKKVAGLAKDAALGLATGGTATALQAGVKILGGIKKTTEALRKIQRGVGKVSDDESLVKKIVIGVAAIFLFLFMDSTTKAGSFLTTGELRTGGSIGETPPGSKIIINGDLVDLFRQVAKNECVPLAMLIAISKQEAGGIWTWSSEEIQKFSTPSWWENATNEEIRRGYCYDTCREPKVFCHNVSCTTNETSGDRRATVYGPMQFEECTWFHYMPEYKLKDRCQLDLALTAAGKKIHYDSGTDKCTNWDRKTVLRVIEKYCGSCNSESCQDYCTKVMRWYDDVIVDYPDE